MSTLNIKRERTKKTIMNFDVRKEFRDFCRSTSLHGWHHLTDNTVNSSQRGNHSISKTKGGGKSKLCIWSIGIFYKL